MKGGKNNAGKNTRLLTRRLRNVTYLKSHEKTDNTIPFLYWGVVNQKQMFLLRKGNNEKPNCLLKFKML